MRQQSILMASLFLTATCSYAASEDKLWDGFYLQANSNNVELREKPHNISISFNKKRDICLHYEWSVNEVKKVGAASVSAIFIKPNPKNRAAQVYEVKLSDLDLKSSGEGVVKRYCWEKHSTDYLPKSRALGGGTQFKVGPQLQPGKTYILVFRDEVIDVFRFAK